jgi:MoaA/NifB/PqqE/SkfB family radical SAM enzyme
MKFWQRVHWFATTACNEKCRFCFKPEFKFEDSPEVMRSLATMLADNGVRQVVFTGGEPLLLKSLDSGLEVLKDGGVDVSVHTNATLLNLRKLRNLAGLVDEIAIPIDSTNRQTQRYLRKADCLPKVKRIYKQLQNQKVRVGVHTVATALNIDHIPKIYDFLCKGRFDYWRIYEYNVDLVGDRLSSEARFKEVRRLWGEKATVSDGGVNCLYARFLLMEERMAERKDKRVQFVGVNDYNREPYFFLDTGGNVYFCTWFLQGKRRLLGNLLEEGFEKVKEKAIQADGQGPLFDEESFIETENSPPLWARAAWNGNYWPEEIDGLNPKHYEKFRKLAELYLARAKRQGEVPKTANLMI